MKRGLLFLAALGAVSMSAFAATEITEGTEYYVRNVKTGMWMNGGYSWGTKGIVKEQARAFQFEAVDGGYKIKSSVGYVKPGGEIYLDGGSEADGGVYQISAQDDGTFVISDSNGLMTIEQNGDGDIYMMTYGDAYDAGIIEDSWESWQGALQSYDFYPIRCANYDTDNAKYWQFLTKEEMVAGLAEASETNPVDATFLIKAFMLDRQDSDNYTAWQLRVNGVEQAIGGDDDIVIFPPFSWGFHLTNEWGDIENEWVKAGTYGWFNNDNTEEDARAIVSQVVTGAPAGFYEVDYHVVDQPNTSFSLTFNGVEGEVSEYHNEEGVPVDLWYASATGVLADRAQIKKCNFTVDNEGVLAIEMTKDCKVGEQNRFAFKSFIIKYWGTEGTGVEAIGYEDVNVPVEYYNLNGMRVSNPSNGIFIVKQGSKVSKQLIRK